MKLPKKMIIALGSVLAVAFILTIVGTFLLGNRENGVQALDPSPSDTPSPVPTNSPIPASAPLLPTATPRVDEELPTRVAVVPVGWETYKMLGSGISFAYPPDWRRTAEEKASATLDRTDYQALVISSEDASLRSEVGKETLKEVLLSVTEDYDVTFHQEGKLDTPDSPGYVTALVDTDAGMMNMLASYVDGGELALTIILANYDLSEISDSDITLVTRIARSVVFDRDSTTVTSEFVSSEPALGANGSTSGTSESLGRGLVLHNANLRDGPGTNYALVGSLAQYDQFDLVARNEAADWYQIATSSGQTAWVAAFLVEDAPDAEFVQPSAPVSAPDAPLIIEGGNRGIEFGRPIVFQMGFGGVLATNTTDQVKTFTAKATYKVGDSIVATAVGAVSELLPGQTRAVTLLSMEPIPDTFDSVRVEIDTMILESQMTDGTATALQIAFGEPAVDGGNGFDMVEVEITNNDTSIHSLIVQAIALKGGELVGVATGAINELYPGQTKTATLLSQGTMQGTEVRLAVETVIK